MLEKTTSQTAQVAKSNNLLQSRPHDEERFFFFKEPDLPFFEGKWVLGKWFGVGRVEVPHHQNNSINMAFAQASSDKVLASAVDVASLAPKALRQVCTLVSACCVGRKADTIISDLENWWHELGQDILFRSDPFADCEPEDLEEEAGDFEPGNGQVTPEKQEEVDLLQSLEMTGNLVATEKELLKYQTGDDQDLPQEFIPEPILEDADSSEDEVAEDGIPFKLDAENVFTLEHVLDGAGLANFKPKKEDSESKKLQRVRILSRQMQHFCAFVRVSERILSRAKVMGMRRPQNQNNLLQHMLAEARQTYQCSALRQSRQALWKDFSSRVVADVEADLDKENGAIRVPQHLGTMAVSKEERKFQLLVVRPCSSSTAFGGLRLGLVVAAWRGGKSKNNEQAQKLRPSGSLPAHYVTTVHVMLLMPYQSGVDAKSYFQTSFIGSFPVGCFQHLFYFIFFIMYSIFFKFKSIPFEIFQKFCVRPCSPVATLDSKDGSILCEISSGNFKTTCTNNHVKVELDEEAMRALHAATSTKTNFKVPGPNSKKDVVFLTEGDLKPATTNGKASIQRFIRSMVDDFEHVFHKAISADGKITITMPHHAKETVVLNDLLARAPAYFMQKFDRKNLPPADKNTPCEGPVQSSLSSSI